MNCEKCQELLSDFVDGALSDADRRTLSAHLEECLSCTNVRGELDSIVSFCSAQRGVYDDVPNERAMWLRIRNVIESEQSATAAAAAAKSSNASRRGWLGRSWELSFSQMALAVSAIIIVVALATALSLQRVRNAPAVQTASASAGDNGNGRGGKMAANATPLVDDRLRQQQAALDYWNNRVEARKVRWNPQMRETFERNLSVYDQAIRDTREELMRNPHDEVSEEMLNAALNDKMELLKEFSEQ
ncbi:MAG: zf-HC2 domain-containing protein [Pyrinomonadaceae bacterium]